MKCFWCVAEEKTANWKEPITQWEGTPICKQHAIQQAVKCHEGEQVDLDLKKETEEANRMAKKLQEQRIKESNHRMEILNRQDKRDEEMGKRWEERNKLNEALHHKLVPDLVS